MSSAIKPIIFGASGFIGQHLINEITIENCFPIARRAKNKDWLTADLLQPHSLETILQMSSTLINLSYAQQASAAENIRMAENLIAACIKSGTTRLIHCSTAVVVGNNPATFVNEKTPCFPETTYEKTKYTIENILLAAASDRLKVYILRPTGVLGPQGQNLKKMFLQLRDGNPIINFLRSILYGRRLLNLVAVKDVVRALLHLCHYDSLASGVYICSADDDRNNNHQSIEILMRKLLLQKSRRNALHLPDIFLETLLKINRSGSGRFINRHYSSQKLFNTGFQRSVSIADAVKNFVLTELKK